MFLTNYRLIYCENIQSLFKFEDFNETNAKSFGNSIKTEQLSQELSSVSTEIVAKNKTLNLINDNKSQNNVINNIKLNNNNNINTNNNNKSNINLNIDSHLALISKIKQFIDSNNNSSEIGEEVKLKLINKSNFETNFNQTINDNVIRRWKISDSPPNIRNSLTLIDKKKDLNNKFSNNTKDFDQNIGQTINNTTLIKDSQELNSSVYVITNNDYESKRIIRFLDNTVLFEVILIIALLVIIVPFVIIVCTVITICLYRKRYPVRMRFGRKFGTIENPDYKHNRSNNLSLNNELKQFS
jgi:hypothetical protein